MVYCYLQLEKSRFLMRTLKIQPQWTLSCMKCEEMLDWELWRRNLVHWGSWLYWFVQRAIKGDAHHIDKLHFAATSVSFVMDIVILIQCCRSKHLYSLCDRRLFVCFVLCVSCYATKTSDSYADLHAQIAKKSKNVPAEEGSRCSFLQRLNATEVSDANESQEGRGGGGV